MKAREAAYLALLASLREESYISDYLEAWARKEEPDAKDYALAIQIAQGTMRMQRLLDHYAHQLATSLKLKQKERALLWMALYQALLMDRIPLYALTDETVTLAKKYCHQTFVRFINAILRKIPKITFEGPSKIAIATSYPDYFVQQLFSHYGEEKSMTILQNLNLPPVTTARCRTTNEIITIENPKTVRDDKSLYIQNVTPITLVKELSKHLKTYPKRILDLCAAPGGKALFTHDLYPNAELHVNDVSEKKLDKLRENFSKYGVEANYHVGTGEQFKSNSCFDLILLDVPCSNSGVLHRRAEARWRISDQTICELIEKQKTLLANAKTLLSDGGTIWYFTCSILPQENEKILESSGMKVVTSELILPNAPFDGGFGAALT